ncbi:MAG: hypothetical protein ACK6DP_00685 [Gemmatimonas sp.]|uniref:hypothetical protein n=1 Tax=Gemmatimonas sp. TaxID=1962908 RepID=UPI00391EF793|nr:hypothetical protein [Gemmatimonadota bacterium]
MSNAGPTGLPSATGPLPVRVVGIVRGRDIDAEATVALDDAALVLSWPQAAAWRLGLTGIEGVAVGARTLTAYLRDHDVLELTGDETLRPLALALIGRACQLPELTRGLRGFGAVGTAAPLHDAHDRWFAPLLEARRAVHGVSDPTRHVALMDGVALADLMRQRIAQIAARQVPGDAAEQRALEAAIEDEASPVFAALARLALAGDVVRHGSEETRLADWRRWVDAAQRVFAEADEGWRAVEELLGAGGGSR